MHCTFEVSPNLEQSISISSKGTLLVLYTQYSKDIAGDLAVSKRSRRQMLV